MNSYYKGGWYKPSPREEIILSEMIQKTVQYLAALDCDTHR